MKKLIIVLVVALTMTSCYDKNFVVTESITDGKISLITDVLHVSKIGDTLVVENVFKQGKRQQYLYGMHRGDIPVDYVNDFFEVTYESVIRIK